MLIRELTQFRRQKRSHELTETYHYIKNKLLWYEVDYETNIQGKKCITRREWYIERIKNRNPRVYMFVIKEYANRDVVMEMVCYEEKYKEENA